MGEGSSRYDGHPSDQPRTSYRTNLLWGIPSALATVALINVFRRLMPDDRLLPFVLAPTIVIVVVPEPVKLAET